MLFLTKPCCTVLTPWVDCHLLFQPVIIVITTIIVNIVIVIVILSFLALKIEPVAFLELVSTGPT